MYQSHVYLEVRMLVTGAQPVFTENTDGSFAVDPDILKKVALLSQALGCTWLSDAAFEHITSTITVPTSYGLKALSLKIAKGGHLGVAFHGSTKEIAIEEIRIEEDAGRLTHSTGKTRMDYTNAGMASIRIKTADTMELGEEGFIFLDELRRLVQYLSLYPAKDAESLIRCNAYVALSQYPNRPGYYVKLRNLNSFNFVRKAINAELTRQEEILTSGGTVVSESRLWNERQNITESYKARAASIVRQFEPLPSSASPAAGFPFPHTSMPQVELPSDRRNRMAKQYGISRSRAELICDQKERADFYEASVEQGADPMDAAHWLSTEVIKLEKIHGSRKVYDNLTAARFARVIILLTEKTIHSAIAKQLLSQTAATGRDPDDIISKNHLLEITDEKTLLPLIRHVMDANQAQIDKLAQGDMAPLEYFTGVIMKKTNGMANPQVVKKLIKRELNISVVYILPQGGAMCGRRLEDGAIAVQEGKIKLPALESVDSAIRYQVVPLKPIMSEELEPGDWGPLIEEVANRIQAGTANGIVIAHGTDTLSYTAALLFWLFSDAGVPVVLTASSATPEESDEARINMKLAVQTACEKTNGVYVVFGGKVLSPLNLKFIRPDADGFVNWNLKEPVFVSDAPLTKQVAGASEEFDAFVLKQILQNASDEMMPLKVYPGLKAERYATLIDDGVTSFILELYAAGTGNMRGSDYSLKSLLLKGRKKECRFYCTSQQETPLALSEYSTSRRVWREGALPMGRLTTESVVALYYAASLMCDSQEELDQCMETYAELYQ
ncbi:MAG: asparaginase domain-containing protein [Treponemataceae bacterium]|nr:asparaginase domain-containing protein [Treponemataceae bacterium]